MGKYFKAFKRAVGAMAEEGGPGAYTIAGHRVRCPHCGNEGFNKGYAQLNTAGLTLLNLDWFNKSATILSCSLCSRIEWFMQAPDRM